jgi:hypothetical protein
MNIIKSIQEKGKGGRNGDFTVITTTLSPQVPYEKSTYGVTDDLPEGVTGSKSPQTTKESPPLACAKCGQSTRFWRSIYSPELHCLACVPPPSPSLVAEIVDYSPGGSGSSDDHASPGSDPDSREHLRDRELRREIIFTTHAPGCFWPDFRKAYRRGQVTRQTPACPHCGAEMLRSNIVKHELKPKRGGWARGSCKACGKEVWPMIPWLPGENAAEGVSGAQEQHAPPG